jgi:MoxR-like ATPase
MTSIQQLNDRIQQQATFVGPLVAEIGKVIVGQERLVERLLIALLTNGHILIEGVPGLAKTLTVRSLAAALDLSFQRIQFTPDLLPADLTGTQIYNPRTGEFSPRKGPIFSNVILADEINRAPAKVQSALLEAMEERQVTLGDTTYFLDEPFMVLATQNPLEQEGTYPLPEAQLDRFMLKVLVQYPTRAEERMIIDRMTGQVPAEPEPVIGHAGIQAARDAVQHQVYVDDKIKEYVLDLIISTREPADHGFKNLAPLIDYGASPRASINLIRAAKALAFLRGRGYVTPDDIKQIAPDVLRHRIGLTFEAEAENISASQIVQQILSRVQVP